MNLKNHRINILGKSLQIIDAEYPVLDLEAILIKAQELTGYNDFGGEKFKIGLKQLIDSAEKEANLTTVGRFSLYNEIINLLCSRLSIYNEKKHNPNTYNRPIIKPLIILGLPRTGTTILYNLLSLDSQFRSPKVWELMFLAPHPPGKSEENDKKRITYTEQNLTDFKKLIPTFESTHPYQAEFPQECIPAISLDFNHTAFEAKYRIPSYQSWVNNSDNQDTYSLHKMVLQYLQSQQSNERWLIKCPFHLGHLNELFTTYPDAQIVQTHRSIEEVIESTYSLMFQMRNAFSKEIDKTELSYEIINNWHQRIENCLTYREKHSHLKSQFFDFNFADFMDNPLKMTEGLYDHFNLNFSEETRKKMLDFLGNNKKDKHGKHNYFKGLVFDEKSKEKFSDYTKQFIQKQKNDQ